MTGIGKKNWKITISCTNKGTVTYRVDDPMYSLLFLVGKLLYKR